MPFDRRHIFNASYSYDVGNIVQRAFRRHRDQWLGSFWNLQLPERTKPSRPSSTPTSASRATVHRSRRCAVARVGNNVSICNNHLRYRHLLRSAYPAARTSSVRPTSTCRTAVSRPAVNQTSGSHQYVNGFCVLAAISRYKRRITVFRSSRDRASLTPISPPPSGSRSPKGLARNCVSLPSMS